MAQTVVYDELPEGFVVQGETFDSLPEGFEVQPIEQQAKTRFPLFEGDVSALSEIGNSPEFNEFSQKALKSSLAANLIADDNELADALKGHIPGAEFSQDAEGNVIAKLPSGGSYYLNEPGLSGQDITKFLTRALLYTPAGKGLQGFAMPTLAKAAGRSAATEAVIQSGEAALGGESNLEDVAIAGAAAPVGQAIGEAARKGLDNVVKSNAANQMLNKAAPTIDRLKSEANKIYAKLDESGVVFSPEKFESLTKQLATKVKLEGFNSKLHPKVKIVLDELADNAEKGLSVSEVDTLRKVAGTAAKSLELDEARLGRMIIDGIDDFIDQPGNVLIKSSDDPAIGQMFKEARGLWGKARKTELIEEAVEKAKNQASGFENGLRVNFRALLNNKKKMRGFSEEEKAALQKVVRGGPAENIAKHLGKLGFSTDQAGSMLLSSLGVAGGAAAGGAPGAVAIPMIGTLARKQAENLTKSNALLARSIVQAGSDSQKIAKSYVLSVPKSKRSVEELTGLFLSAGPIDLKPASKMGDKLIKDAAYFASLIQTSSPIPVEDSLNSKADN